MRRRTTPARAWIALALLAAGCQDYNFNPVGHCLLQPGSERITLDNLSTADILFVVDDSGSMGQEQADLATNFTTFVNTLNDVNVERNGDGLDPLDFHIAITSTSVFATSLGGTCQASCGGLTNVCCTSGSTPYQPPVYCQSNDECSSGNTCKTGCFGLTNELVCCTPQDTVERRPSLACSSLGETCGDVKEQYRANTANGCVAGVAPLGKPYPQGDFLGASGNPLVISFDKALYPRDAAPDTAGIAQRIGWFQDNIEVGTCGSGHEQALEAGRLALKKAFRRDGMSQPSGAASWPHEDAKLVVVFVGDEDDCSTPKDDPLILRTFANHDDSCFRDTTKRFPVNEYADFLESLGRPYSAAFIESSVCSGGTCTPNVCCIGAGTCESGGSETEGRRFSALAAELRRRGRDVVEGSICSDFGTLLGQVAELVKPPSNLVLPTQPANTDIAILRVVKEDGATRTTCRGPAPAGTSGAELASYDWWFVDQEGATTPSEASRFVVINHETGRCEANPGETYSADYLGQVPAGGCADAAECASILGGDAGGWICEGADAGTGRRGTCLCQ